VPANRELLRLDIPAQPAFVQVARAVVSTVATSIEGIDDDRLDDLRLAVSEVCTNAVEAEGGQRVVVRCSTDDEHLDVVVEDPASTASDVTLAESGFALQLVNALVDDVAFSTHDGVSAVRLRMHLLGH
jgi:anti-sigma regulatory factor (Ser/Thr protein kinase)